MATFDKADHRNDQKFPRLTVHIILDQNLHAFLEMQETDHDGQSCDYRWEGAGIIGGYSRIILAQHRTEGEDEHRHEDEKRNRGYLCPPVVLGPRFGRAHADRRAFGR